MPIPSNVTAITQPTPLIRLDRITRAIAPGVTLLAKLEWMHPSGSEKDRVARAMLDQAEADGVIGPETTIIEPTSGNIGLSLAMLCAVRGYPLILIMPEVVPTERVKLLRALGAQVVLTPAFRGMQGAITRAEALLKSTPHSWMPRQFENPATARAHEATGHEIWQQTDGQIDALVAGVGTGGILMGCARVLKAQQATIHTVAVQPAASPSLTGGTPGPHHIYGLGAPFIPPIYDPSLVDEVLSIEEPAAYATLKRLFQEEGLFAGPSSGATIAGALLLARRPTMATATIVAVLPDHIERYAGTDTLDHLP